MIAEHRIIIGYQLDLAVKCGLHFEAMWGFLGVRGREAAFEQAINEMAGQHLVGHKWHWCPEVNKAELCAGPAGAGFIRILHHFALADRSTPSVDFPILFDHRFHRHNRIDKPGDPPGFPRSAVLRAFHDFLLVQRHEFLVRVVMATMGVVVLRLEAQTLVC